MVKMHTDFPGGNGWLLDENSDGNTTDIVFRAETKWREPQANWFNFLLEGLSGRTLRLHFANAQQCLDDFGVQDWVRNNPVYRAAGGEWKRVETVQCVMNELRCYDVFFDVPVLSGSMQFAFCYPYQLSDLMGTLEECENLRHTAIGYSAMGRPLVRISTNIGDEARSKKGVYIVGRQHAGEVTGTWQIDGILRFLNSAEGREMTKNQMWWLLPAMDVDGVEEGCYGKDQVWGDFNRSWAAPYPPHVETHALQHDMEHWSRFSTPALFCDMHSPGNDVRGHIFNVHMEMGKEQLDKVDAITAKYNENLKACGLEPSVNHYKFNKSKTSSANGTLSWEYASYTYNVPAIVSETSYQGPSSGGTYSLENYRTMGECFARAIAEIIG